MNNIEKDTFQYVVDKFADIEVLRYKVDGFENLTLKQKLFIYYLSEAAQEGRDILFDQNYEHNLCVRRTLEAIYENENINKADPQFLLFEEYLKRVWFSNGIHHHYSTDKIEPLFNQAYFEKLLASTNQALFPLQKGESFNDFSKKITSIIFDKERDKKRVNLAEGKDLIATSANHYYKNVTQQEAEYFYRNEAVPNNNDPISYGLNSRLEKENGKIVEKTWKINGIYSRAIERIIFQLNKSVEFAENEQQKEIIRTLIDFYQTGNLKTFDKYSILWVKDTASQIDFLNGFIETYGDPLGIKASWEAIVNFKNEDATLRTKKISENAQWFEDHSPVEKCFKKEKVKGVSAKVITNAMLGGDSYPATPIGINLPNSNWIRQEYGSKSVTIENITEAYDKASQGNGFSEEFMWSNHEIEMSAKYGFITGNLHTDLHECVGHGSGKLLEGVSPDALKAYDATIEEARADLFGLYYIADSKMVELGLLPNEEAYKAEYYKFMLNGLMTQLVRIKPNDCIEESHMRNRQLIARWVFEKGQHENVVEFEKRDNKTFVVINDYGKLRVLFGQLLAEIQRVKSEGDYDTAKRLIETYGIKIDTELHSEILRRYQRLNIRPYRGFINPLYVLKKDKKGDIQDVIPTYNETFIEQMMRYSKTKSYLPTYN